MKLITLSAAIAVCASMAIAQEQDPGEVIPTKASECNAIFPFSLLEETSEGENCPPNAVEKAAGDLMFGAVVFTLGAEAISGGEVFPLNAGILSGL